MGRLLVHTGLSLLSLVAHVLHYPPPPTRTRAISSTLHSTVTVSWRESVVAATLSCYVGQRLERGNNCSVLPSIATDHMRTSPVTSSLVVISRLFSFSGEVITSHKLKKKSFSGEAKDSAIFPFFILLHKRAIPIHPPYLLPPPTHPPIPHTPHTPPTHPPTHI